MKVVEARPDADVIDIREERGSIVRLAAGQWEPVLGDPSGNLEASSKLIARAAQSGASVIVLPELSNTGYMFRTRAEAWSLAEAVPSGPFCERVIASAREHDIYIVAGVTEKDGGYLFDTAVLVGPSGFIGTYRKTHLWYEEKLFFTPGDLGYPVFETPIGRIGMLICWDMWFPETFRILSRQDADLVCIPTNWVWPTHVDENGRLMANYVAMVQAHMNGLFIIAADRIGIERGQKFLGGSLIVGPSGSFLAGPASADSAELVLSEEVNLGTARRSRAWNDLSHLLNDRRTDLYDDMLGYQKHSKTNPSLTR